MNERIKELVEQAGLTVLLGNNWLYGEQLEEFAELVRQDEREACAKVCEEREEYSMPIPCPDGIAGCCVAHFVRGSKIKDGKECAAAIRARSKHDVSKVSEADALPPTANAVYWMDMVVANLVRNGVNKHRARELAYHFYTYTTPRKNNNG